MTSAVRTLKLLGCEMLFVTNAAGSLRTDVDAGSLVAITDHINWLPGTPMVGPNDDRFGPRFSAWPTPTTARSTIWSSRRPPTTASRCTKAYSSPTRARTSKPPPKSA
ncbi:hypothetical protein LP419_10775 [Massilia sp. H-1]|nr:hypothetical protein LP419_10775 [Massilia sp. H-1]